MSPSVYHDPESPVTPRCGIFHAFRDLIDGI